MKNCFLCMVLVLTMNAVATPSFGDVKNGNTNADGTMKGKITAVTYDENGIKSVTFKEDGTSTEFTIENGDLGDTRANPNAGNDIDQFGSVLEAAYKSGDNVSLETDLGNLTGVKVEKPNPN